MQPKKCKFHLVIINLLIKFVINPFSNGFYTKENENTTQYSQYYFRLQSSLHLFWVRVLANIAKSHSPMRMAFWLKRHKID